MARWLSVLSVCSVILCFELLAMPSTCSMTCSSAWWPIWRRPFSAPGRAGLAANQIGVSRRVFAYNIDGQVGHLVNPVIEATEGEQEDEEGCLSIPGLWYR
jgi:hypothetical protein